MYADLTELFTVFGIDRRPAKRHTLARGYIWLLHHILIIGRVGLGGGDADRGGGGHR